METFGLALQNAMLDAGLRQTQLASIVGAHLNTVNRHIHCHRPPDVEQMRDYARALGVQWIVDGDSVDYRRQPDADQGSAA